MTKVGKEQEIVVEYRHELRFSRSGAAARWTEEEWQEALAAAENSEIDHPAFDWRDDAVVDSEVDDVWLTHPLSVEARS